MIRKAVLVGCRKGPWISIQGLKNPRLRISGAPDMKLGLEYPLENGESSIMLNLRPGEHEIREGSFVRASVLEGDHESVLCDIVSCHS